MPLLNGFEPRTRAFLQTLGKIAGVANLASLAMIALLVLFIATNVMRLRPSTRNERRIMSWLREHKVIVVLLSILALWAVWAVGGLIVSNMELAGVLGLGSLLKLLFF
jgi:hypothetical protein